MPPKKAADAGAGEEAKFKKTKPAAKALSAAEAASDVAQGASMARNAEIVKFLESVAQGYHDSAEWMKKANANKAARAVKALTTPIAVARQLSALEGCGKGTIEKVAAFLEANPVAAPEAVAAQADDEGACARPTLLPTAAAYFFFLLPIGHQTPSSRILSAT